MALRQCQVQLESQNEERENREELFEEIMAKAFLKLMNKNNPKIQKPRGSEAYTHTHTHTPHTINGIKLIHKHICKHNIHGYQKAKQDRPQRNKAQHWGGGVADW